MTHFDGDAPLGQLVLREIGPSILHRKFAVNLQISKSDENQVQISANLHLGYRRNI